MTNHYDDMRVSPDPSQAEALRARLQARLADTMTDDHRDGPVLELHPGRHPDEPEVPAVELAVPDTATAGPRPHRRRALVAAAAAVVAVAAAGIAMRGDDPPPVATAAPTSTPPTTDNDCPLTADDVSQVLGLTIGGPESLTDCYFANGPSIAPSASFGYDPASSCTQESLRDEGYVGASYSIGAVDGLGVDAYAQRNSLGVTVIVCDGDRPFNVHVEFIGDDQAAAIALAELVLER